MKISLNWLNEWLSEPVTAEEADRLLTAAGFPIEEHVAVATSAGVDVMLDVEVTSNRGDCLSHSGCAREIVACSGGARSMVVPDHTPAAPAGDDISASLSLENREPGVCPRFTARLIRGCSVGASPDWLVAKLEAIGQRSINNAVDITNLITFELGNPCHVFDLGKLEGNALVVRFAGEGEALTTLDGKPRTLKSTDLVVADAARPQSLAGVIGGQDSEVGGSTTDIVLEMATWDPVTIRTAARRMAIRTDAGFRFERIVNPRTIDAAADRAARLIAELTGGSVAPGVLDEGAPMPEPVVVDLRPARCDRVLGIETSPERMIEILRSLEIEPEVNGESLRCTIPAHRQDLTREIDLIEEVARVRGYDDLLMTEKLDLRVRHPQEPERAQRELDATLTGLGFYETVTFSFVNERFAGMFKPGGLDTVKVDDERRGSEPYLRPSVLPGLLSCRRANQDAQNHPAGGVRLYERSAVFGETAPGASAERRVLGLLLDVPGDKPTASHEELETGLRRMRGAIDALVRSLAGPHASVSVEPGSPPSDGFEASAYGSVAMTDAGGKASDLGGFGLVSDAAREAAGLDRPVVAAELDLGSLTGAYPPAGRVSMLPAFPGIARDVSLVLPEETTWARVDDLVRGSGLDRLVGWSYVGVFRGDSVGAGKKSLTFRLEFRDAGRTLRHEEVTPQVDSLVSLAANRLGAEQR